MAKVKSKYLQDLEKQLALAAEWSRFNPHYENTYYNLHEAWCDAFFEEEQMAKGVDIARR